MQYGYFDDDNKEYVIDRPDILFRGLIIFGVNDLCTVISNNAGGYSFINLPNNTVNAFAKRNSLDRPGHYVYIRDDETGEFWTISWQPVGKILQSKIYLPSRFVLFKISV